MNMLRALCLCALLTPVALAQEAGERLWTVDVASVDVGSNVYMSQPRVAPDGTVYLVTDSLYAISPAGEILWAAAGRQSYVDVGPDGTVYTAASGTIYAYHPDGTERWRFTDTEGFGITTGPTVGPDGNLYAVFIQGGLGVFSLTPDGDFRWNVPGFLTDGGTGMGRVAFGPDNLYYADEALWPVEGCTAPYTGMVSITLDGDLEWCRSITGVEEPPIGVQSTLDGRAVVIRRAVPAAGVYVYTPDGSLDWAYTEPSPTIVVVGPDDNLYAWFGTTLISLTADGEERWSEAQPINNFPWRAEVAPDTSAVVAGSVYGFGENGIIVAADPADGSTLWSLPVTGPSAGAGAPAAFSPDGAVVYVSVNTLSLDVPDQLWAIQVHEARATPTELAPPRADNLAFSSVYPNPFGGSARFALSVPRRQRVTVEVLDVLGRRVALLHEGALPAGPEHAFTFEAGALPSGVYLLRATGEASAASRRLTRLD